MRSMDVAYWKKIERTLERLVAAGAYERANSYISLGMAAKLRGRLLNYVLSRGNVVLDLGCGPLPYYSLIARFRPDLYVCVDPSIFMLRSMPRGPHFVERITAVAEYLPVRRRGVDYVVAMFSFRDFMGKGAGLREMLLAARRGIAVLDVFRPRNPLGLLLASLYLMIVAPLLAFVATGVRGGGWSEIYRTMLTMPTAEALAKATGGRIVEGKAMGLLALVIADLKG